MDTTEIVEQITDEHSLLSGGEVTPIQLKGLSDTLFRNLYILENGQLRQMDCSNPKPAAGAQRDMSKADTKTAYFEKDIILKLFSDNPSSNGLLIYFGVHDKNVYPAMRQPGYQNKLMVVLATTTAKIPNTKIGDHVLIAGGGPVEDGGGGGQDNGKLCPPDTTC
jgi:hypothetical protein